MRNICQIVGYMKARNNEYRHKRVIMKNLTNEKYKFYLYIQSYFSHFYTANYLENEDNVYYFNSNEELDVLLKKHNINKIIMSQVLHPNNFYKCIENFNPKDIYFLAHGIGNPVIDKNIYTWWYETMRISKINLILLCKTQYEVVSPHNKNVHKIGTLPQIDNLSLKECKKNTILIIDQGNYNLGNQLHIQNRKQIFDYIAQHYDYPIYYKPYDNCSDSIIHNYPNITNLINKNVLTYDYFDSDIIICINFGTSYIEALLSNSKVIFIILPLLSDKQLTQSKILSPSSHMLFAANVATTINKGKYPHLLIVSNFNQLNHALTITKNNSEYFNSEEYLKDKNQLIKDYIGEYKPDFNKQLIEIIEKNSL